MKCSSATPSAADWVLQEIWAASRHIRNQGDSRAGQERRQEAAVLNLCLAVCGRSMHSAMQPIPAAHASPAQQRSPAAGSAAVQPRMQLQLSTISSTSGAGQAGARTSTSASPLLHMPAAASPHLAASPHSHRAGPVFSSPVSAARAPVPAASVSYTHLTLPTKRIV